MGAWGHTTFENDDALDWWETFRDRPTRDMLERTFVFISEAGNDEFIEAPECGAAIAAAEIVAALRGSPATNLPEDIVAWLSLPQELNIDNEIVEIALASLARETNV